MKIIENISKFQLRDNYIIYYHQKGNIYINSDFNGDLLSNIEVKDCHWFFDDIKYLQIEENGTIGYYSDNKLEKQLLNYYRPIVDNIGVAHVFSTYDSRLHTETLFHLPDEKQIINEWLPNNIYHISDKFWCNDTIADFKLIDIQKKEILWAIPQPEVMKPSGYKGLTNTKKVLGIYKNNLWIQLPDSRILALDKETGIIKYEIEHFYFSSIPEGIFLDQRGVIIIFHYNVYAEFCLDDKIFKIENIIGSEKELIIRHVTHHNGDKYLYFTGNKDNSFEPNVYGTFNTFKQTFEFIREKEPEMGFFYQAPQVNEELFTILDDKGNLIIHKRDEI